MLRIIGFCPTVNLTTLDPQCGDFRLIMAEAVRSKRINVMSNKLWLFGGINTSFESSNVTSIDKDRENGAPFALLFSRYLIQCLY